MMHQILYNKLRISTFLLQFYGWLARGLFTEQNRKAIDELIQQNIERLELMRSNFNWDGRYDLVMELDFKTNDFITEAKNHLNIQQIATDEDIAQYLHDHPEFFEKGIVLFDLMKIIDISREIKRGHFLHDIYMGYPEHYYLHQIECLDYCYSAHHFYNEGFDYYHGRKQVKNYSEIDITKVHFTEQKRIQPAEEVMLRNFREAFINIIFFVESFINSVGYDAFLKGIAKNADEKNQLRGFNQKPGKSGKSFLQLRRKIEHISQIISGTIIDCEREPFQSYLQINVELRNAYIHSSPDKPKIYFTFEDWKRKCDEMIDGGCYNILQAFWKACFPATPFPVIIFNAFYASSFKGRPGKMMAEPN